MYVVGVGLGKVYKALITLAIGALSIPLFMSMSKAFSTLLHFNKTLLHTHTHTRKKEESSRKTSISALLTMPKPLTVWITINCGKF